MVNCRIKRKENEKEKEKDENKVKNIIVIGATNR